MGHEATCRSVGSNPACDCSRKEWPVCKKCGMLVEPDCKLCFDFGYYEIQDYINEWIWHEAFPSIQRPCVCWNGAPPRDREKFFFLPRHDKTEEYRARHGWDYMSLREIIEGLVEFHNVNRLGPVPTSLLRKALKETHRANKARLKLVQEKQN